MAALIWRTVCVCLMVLAIGRWWAAWVDGPFPGLAWLVVAVVLAASALLAVDR